MEDIEVARKDATLLDEKDQTNGGFSKIGDNTTLQSDKANFTMEDQLPDRGDFGGGDFLEDGFGGGMMDLDNLGGPGEVPNISDITLERDQQGVEEGTGFCAMGDGGHCLPPHVNINCKISINLHELIFLTKSGGKYPQTLVHSGVFVIVKVHCSMSVTLHTLHVASIAHLLSVICPPKYMCH